MIAVWWATTALADPVALRGPQTGPTATIGLHELSAAAPLLDSPWEIAAHLRTDRGAAGVAIGRRVVLKEGDGPWRADAGLSGGVLLALVSPSPGLTATPWVAAGPVGNRASLQGVLALPMAATVGGGLRLPVLLELQGGVRAGPAWILPRLGLGPVFTPGTDVSVATEASLMLTWTGPAAR
ncbi:MAG: hypothetical protein KTR31_26545 [Myxococcales bacterium]|nr:hypothetical protein [Myxococcales bacterium]